MNGILGLYERHDFIATHQSEMQTVVIANRSHQTSLPLNIYVQQAQEKSNIGEQRIYLMTNSIVLLSIRFHISEALANMRMNSLQSVPCSVHTAHNGIMIMSCKHSQDFARTLPVLCQYFASSTYYLVD